ncbi:hypothetical protein BJX66DRAFT_339627 [Aspergillus keveii]|uniref:Uncharacterized protein n=1 Tax=Aspergillus keveii TaxID=714993 RepID=A0ABR4G0M2_9EURO
MTLRTAELAWNSLTFFVSLFLFVMGWLHRGPVVRWIWPRARGMEEDEAATDNSGDERALMTELAYLQRKLMETLSRMDGPQPDLQKAFDELRIREKICELGELRLLLLEQRISICEQLIPVREELLSIGVELIGDSKLQPSIREELFSKTRELLEQQHRLWNEVQAGIASLKARDATGACCEGRNLHEEIARHLLDELLGSLVA